MKRIFATDYTDDADNNDALKVRFQRPRKDFSKTKIEPRRREGREERHAQRTAHRSLLLAQNQAPDSMS